MLSLLSLGGLGSGSSLRGSLGRWGDVVLGVLASELDEVIESAFTVVLEEVGASGGLEHESGEASDLEGSAWGKVVLGGVHLGDGDLVLHASVVLTELLPGRSKALAVTAPWSVEFDEDVLGVVEDDLVVLGANNNLDGAVVLRGDLSGLERGLESASGELGGPVLDGREGRNNTRHGVLGSTLDVLDDESGPVVHLEVESLGVVGVLDSVDPDEVDLALVLLGNGLDGVDVLLELLIIRVDEHVGERKTGLGVSGVVLAGNLVEESDRVVEDELLEDLDVGVLDAVDGEVSATVVELLVDNDGRGLDASDLGGVLIGGDTEEVVVTVLLSDLGESGSRSVGLGAKVGNDDDLVGGLEFLVVGGGDFANSGEGLPRRGWNAWSGTSAFRRVSCTPAYLSM